ncbi:MAG: hypothetical protein HY892_02980 [Deltaproteobacteria bacterium]|nr:hypothetical protein [Deltaproteobacteria bacterium]
MTIKKIKELIDDRIQPTAWEIRRLRKKSFQRYLIFKDQESLRVVDSEKFLVTLYKEYPRGEGTVLGESTVTVQEGDDLRERIEAAWEMAALVANPVFKLPEKGLVYSPVNSLYGELKKQPLFYLDKIRDDLIKTPLPGVKLSSAEIFLDFKEEQILNSNGLEQEREEGELLLEFVLLAEEGAGFGGESWGWRQGRFYEHLKIREAVRRYANFAREAQTARLPRGGTFPVVFSEEALDTLFNFFIAQASGGARFQGWSRMEIGAPVIRDLRGEALTLTSNPTVPGLLKTRSFDTQGLPVQKVEVIRENVFNQRTNNKRYADYLGEPATGDFANVEVAPGLKSTQDLLSTGPCFHLLRFSTFEPNPITGAFSGEIRTGYFLENGRAEPIKGGSVSGVISEAFQEAYFSREVTQRSSYLGPEAVRLEQVEIAGE